MTKVCILAAGRGSRNDVIEGLHKALLPINNRPMISHIFECIPAHFEIVIAVGYKKDQIKDYVRHVFPNRKVTFVEIENYDRPGSGPGLSLLSCSSELQCPFIFMPVDTYTPGHLFAKVTRNWIGSAEIQDNDKVRYCLIEGVETLSKIGYGIGSSIFNGIAGIYNYKDFWLSLSDPTLIKNEHQVINGFKELTNVKIRRFDNFYDTGNSKSYKAIKQRFSRDVVLPKPSEVIYIDNSKVVKYFADTEKVTGRILRAKALEGFVPDVTQMNKNFYCYEFVKGIMLSDVHCNKRIDQFFQFLQGKFYLKRFPYTKEFEQDCIQMYLNKTMTRSLFYEGHFIDQIETINGIKVSPIKKIIETVNWKEIVSNAIPANIHGDLQPENILVNGDFTLIDWRESFGQNKNSGDIYYDLSKLYHAILINGTYILNGNFDFNIGDNEVFLNYSIKSNLFEMLEKFEKFCKENDYDWNHVRLLGAIHYINIAPFYGDYEGGKYSKFIFLLGKFLLTKHINFIKEQEKCGT